MYHFDLKKCIAAAILPSIGFIAACGDSPSTAGTDEQPNTLAVDPPPSEESSSSESLIDFIESCGSADVTGTPSNDPPSNQYNGDSIPTHQENALSYVIIKHGEILSDSNSIVSLDSLQRKLFQSDSSSISWGGSKQENFVAFANADSTFYIADSIQMSLACNKGNGQHYLYSIYTTGGAILKALLAADPGLVENFNVDCTTENGNTFTGEKNITVCTIPFVNPYTDPFWSKYGKAIISYCNE